MGKRKSYLQCVALFGNFEMNFNFKIFLLTIGIQQTCQHGFLADPPQRSSLWRENHDAPVNYNDNQLYCGGRENLRLNGGKCGPCGDPYQGPRENEAGGKYAKGIIVRSYPSNQRKLPVKVVLTAHHKGYFEFKICPHNDPYTPVSQACLDHYPLKVAEGSRRHPTRYYPNSYGDHYMTLLLPPGFQCSQCVLQWRYRTGNSWGVDEKGRGCIGCGNQEEFWNCADIQIGYTHDRIYKKGSDSDSDDSGEDYRSNLVKDSGIKIHSQFFSPFAHFTSGKMNGEKSDVFHDYLESKADEDSSFEVDGATRHNLLGTQVETFNFPTNSLHKEGNTMNIMNSNFTHKGADSASRFKLNTNSGQNTLNLQTPRNPQPKVQDEIPVSNQVNPSTLRLMSLLFGHNPGTIQTSFVPAEDWSLLPIF